MTDAAENFRVDLRGVVDLLSNHLYSSPRVFLRELLQNGVDAITARRAIDPSAPGQIVIEAPSDATGGLLRVTDSGIGLTADEMHELLATVGRSSKRDEFSLARSEYIGQFGIGLLSCFMVAEEIVVLSRSGRTPDAPTVEWRGRADGTFAIAEASAPLPEVGSVVLLRPRRDESAWFDPRTLEELATHYGSMLPIEVRLDRGDRHDTVLLSEQPAPATWSAEKAVEYCRDTFGFDPLAVIPLRVDLAGVAGLAFVLPTPTNPAEKPSHRVYLKSMLLADSVEGLLPEWAFFVRCVLDTSALRPTASREALFEDDLLSATRSALGRQLTDWLIEQAVVSPAGLERFLSVHRLGVMAMAVHDDELLGVVAEHVRFETTLGRVTVIEFLRTHPDAGYTRTSDEYRGVAGIAAAHGVGIINAGHTYEEEILHRLAETLPGFSVHELDATDLAARLDPLDADAEWAARGLVAKATAALAGRDLDVVVRRFDPPTVPALFLADGNRARGVIEKSAAESASDFWSGLLTTLEPVEVRSTFVLNHANPLVRRLAGIEDESLVGTVAAGLYVQALLQGRHPVPADDAALLSTSFLALIERVLAGSTAA